MFLTPGFRDALFRIPIEELGYTNVDGENAGNTRAIPFELQSLFAAMARQDQSSVSTEALTKSFGWSAGDAVVQHDVQELNRIFFDAIEKSLAGTTYEGLIKQLYGGSLVNLIKCRNCNTVRRLDEAFLDVTVPLQGLADLPAGLASYTTMEVLDGSNQYRCDKCDSLQDAEKGIRLSHLPPILALSLNRFSYDWQRDTRVKVTTPFPFPLTLDMAPYCENPDSSPSSRYELYSVVIHGGAAHGGHYHAYIRDFYQEGHWVKAESPGGTVLVREKQDTPPPRRKGKGRGRGRGQGQGQGDAGSAAAAPMIKVAADPLPILLRAVLELSQERAANDMSDISKKLGDLTGHSWNTAYKSSKGPLSAFLAQHKDLFVIKGNLVSLTDAAVVRATEAIAAEQQQAEDAGDDKAAQDELAAALALSLQTDVVLDEGQHWFDFNDSRVSCIPVTALEKQYGGKESAYMLFYASSAFVRSQRKPVLPSSWHARMDMSNMLLAEARRAADLAAHTLDLHVHLAPRYRLGTVLHATHPEAQVPFAIDERTPTSALAALLRERYPELGPDALPFYVATPLRDGQLALQRLVTPESDGSTLLADGFRPHMHVLVGSIAAAPGDSATVGGEVLAVKVTDGRVDTAPDQTVFTYPDTSLQQLRHDIAETFACAPSDFVLVRADRKQWTKAAAMLAFAADKDRMAVGALGVKADTHLLLVPPAPAADPVDPAEPETTDAAALTAAAGAGAGAAAGKIVGPSEEVLRRIKDSVTVNVSYRDNKKLPSALQLTLDTAKTIAEWRAAVAGALGCDAAGTRLKVQRQAEWELLVPEDKTAKDMRIDGGTVLGLDSGPLPAPDELFLLVRINAKKDTPLMEVVLQQSMTVAEAVATLVAAANLPAGDYHLARTNWTGDPDKALTEADQTLSAANLSHNTLLVLQAGRVVPKGSARVGLFLDVQSLTDTMRELITPLLTLPDRRNPDDIVERLADLSLDSLMQLGDAVFPLTATLEDIKQHALTLPVVGAVCASTAAVRVRELEGLRMTRMLSDPTRMLKQLKFPATGKHLALTLLSEPDTLEPTTLFLNVCRRITAVRKCTRTRLILLNAGAAPTLEHLTNILSVEFSAAPEDLVLAKYDKSAREWKVFSTAGQSRKTRRKGPTDGSLREAPFLLKDGDLIAVKLHSEDPKNTDDFSLPVHRDPAPAAAAAAKRPPRPEPRLAIHVPAFPQD